MFDNDSNHTPHPANLDTLEAIADRVCSDEYTENVHYLAACAAWTRHIVSEMELEAGKCDGLYQHETQDRLALQIISDNLARIAEYFYGIHEGSGTRGQRVTE